MFNKIIKAKSVVEASKTMQMFYALEQKTAEMINKLPDGDLKIKYQSAQELGKMLFTKQKTHHITFETGTEKKLI